MHQHSLWGFPFSVTGSPAFWAGALIAFLFLASPALADGPAPERDEQRFEIGFLTDMIDHHYAAVKMAELCAGRATHAELLEMCETIRTAQAAEIATMQGWLLSWYGVQHEPELRRRTQRHLESLGALTGAEFETAFMTRMAFHHAEALVETRDCLLRAWHPESIALCAMMAGAQADEIAMLRLWLRQWHGIEELDRRWAR